MSTPLRIALAGGTLLVCQTAHAGAITGTTTSGWTTVHETDFAAGDDPGIEWSPDKPVSELDVLHGGTGVKDSTLRVLGPFADDPLTSAYDAGVDLTITGIPSHDKLRGFFTVALFEVQQSGGASDGTVTTTWSVEELPASAVGFGTSVSATSSSITGTADISGIGSLETLLDGEQTPTPVYQIEVRLPEVGPNVRFPLPPLGNDVFDTTLTAPGRGWQWGVLGAEVQVFNNAAVVPEPSNIALLGMCAFGLAGYCWRRRRNSGPD